MLGTFLLGAALYPALELAWRRRTHPSMALAGGLALCLLRALDRRMPRAPLSALMLLGGLGITAVEYGVGLVFNRRHQIWDYRKTPCNLRGQICAPYALMWCALSGAAIGAMRLVRKARL